MAEEIEKYTIDIDAKASISSVGDLRRQLKELRGVLLSTEEGTEEYNNALQRTQELTHRMTVANEQVRYATQDFGQYVSNVTTTLGGFSGALTGVQSAMNLLGVESESTNEAILKLQSLSGLTQAFGSIDTGVKAFKGLTTSIKASTQGLSGFRKALIATGLGALVVVLGTIIANWEELTEWLGISSKTLDVVKDAFAGVMNVAKNGIKSIGQALAKLVKGDFSGALEAVKNGFNVVQNFSDGMAKSAKEREDKIAKEEAEKRKKKAEEDAKKWKEYVTQTRNALDQARKYKEAFEKNDWKYTEDGQKYYKKYFDNLKALYKKNSAEYQNVLIDEHNYLLEIGKRNEQAIKASNAQRLADIKQRLTEQEIAERERYLQGEYDYKTLTDKLKALNDDYTQSYIDELKEQLQAEGLTADERVKLQNELNATLSGAITQPEEEKKEEEKTPFDLAIDAIAEVKDSLSNIDLGGLSALINQFDKLSEVATKVNEGIKKDGKEAWKSYASAAASGFSSIGGMLGELANQQDASGRKGFETQKKLQMASAVMNTFAGAISAYNSMSGIPIVGPALGAIFASAVLAFGGVQVANISKQKYGDGANVSGSASVPSATALSGISAPVQSVTQVEGASAELNAQPTRVYVTEQDIRSTSQRVDVAQKEATF